MESLSTASIGRSSSSRRRSNVDAEVWGDSDEGLVERAMVDRAQAQPVVTTGSPASSASPTMCAASRSRTSGVGNRAAILYGKNGAAELRLVDPLLDLVDDVATLDSSGMWTGSRCRMAAHLPEGQEDAKLGWLVSLDKGRVDGPVPVRRVPTK